MNTILHERQLEEYYCTLCYALFDFKRRTVTLANSGLPYPIRCSGDTAAQIELPGVPLGSFAGSIVRRGDVRSRGRRRLRVLHATASSRPTTPAAASSASSGCRRSSSNRARSRRASIVDAIFAAVADFRGDTRANDDMTAVAIKINS